MDISMPVLSKNDFARKIGKIPLDVLSFVLKSDGNEPFIPTLLRCREHVHAVLTVCCQVSFFMPPRRMHAYWG